MNLANSENDFEILFDTALDVDAKSVRDEIIGDETINLLRYKNRIALSKGQSKLINSPKASGTGFSYYDVPLICVVHSHPECRFRWSRLNIDLRPTKGAVIQDMSPYQVDGNKPVELKTTVGLGLKFEIVPETVSGEIKPEISKSRTVYYPKIVSSGKGFNVGYWDFLALDTDYLHANRELRLLLSAPIGIPVQARFRLRAKVKFAGLASLIPLLANKGEISKLYRII